MTSLPLALPPRAGRGAGDRAAALRAEGSAGRSPFEATEATEGRGVRVRFARDGSPGADLGSLGRRLAARAGGTDFVGVIWLGDLLHEVADQAAASAVRRMVAGFPAMPERTGNGYLFRRDTGVSPARYLHTLRMERARLLLERTFLSVKEVMAYVGVNDPSHFSRDFRRYHGVPPTGVRNPG